LVYLDPHYCRSSIIEKYGNTRCLEDGFDSLEVDPSLSLALFCESAEAFDKLSRDLQKYWPSFEPYPGTKAKIEMREFDDMCAPNYVIDDGFEVLEETEDQLTDLTDDVLES
ncbi:hypothetical protein ANCDUO_24808, partial [Ancylostoma duodenale]